MLVSIPDSNSMVVQQAHSHRSTLGLHTHRNSSRWAILRQVARLGILPSNLLSLVMGNMEGLPRQLHLQLPLMRLSNTSVQTWQRWQVKDAPRLS